MSSWLSASANAGLRFGNTQLLGGQGNVWTEWISSEDHLEYMTFPRALALADAVWSPTSRESYERFLMRMQPHLARLEQLGVNYRKS